MTENNNEEIKQEKKETKNNIVCDYCGGSAIYKLKNGKYCCSENVIKCYGKNSIKKLNKQEINIINDKYFYLKELDDSPLDIYSKPKSRKIKCTCEECKKEKIISLYDFLSCKHPTLCKSCSLLGDKNPSKLDHVREKLSRRGVKNTNYVTPEWREKFSNNRKGKNNPMFGKKHSPESNRKRRIKMIEYKENHFKNKGQMNPMYNQEACRLIEQFNKKYGFNFQHAENGGEYHIKELGYWVDGYDEEQNIVIEVDEKHHFDFYGNLSEKDLNRQKEIENFLNCQFIRIRI